MGNFITDGIDDFMLTMENIANTPDSVLNNMVQAGGKILEESTIGTGMSMGVYRTGVTLDSVKLGKPKNISGGKEIYVTFEGTNADGNRNAEVAFVNEFGKTRQAGRPFVAAAVNESADDCNEAAADIYYEWLERQ